MKFPKCGWPVQAIMAVIVLAVLSGCSDDDKVVVPPDELGPPGNLTFINAEGEVLLDWDSSADASRSDFAGYGVYRHTTSMAGATAEEIAGYRLNPTPTESTYYVDGGVQEMTRYFYAVRAVLDNGRVSEPSNEIHTAPRNEFAVDALYEFAASAQPSGLDCSTGEVFAMRSSSPDNRPFIDVYLGTVDSGDDPGQHLALKSPHLVNSADPNWAARAAGLKLLDSFDDPTTADGNWEDHILLGGSSQDVVGKVVAVRVPVSAEGEYHYAKILVESMGGDPGGRRLSLLVAYQPIPDYIRFRGRQ